MHFYGGKKMQELVDFALIPTNCKKLEGQFLWEKKLFFPFHAKRKQKADE